MNGTHMIDSCQTHLPLQYASNMELICQSDTVVVIDSEPQPSHMCKTSLLFAPLAVHVHADFGFSVLHS